jgi:formylmethanofuran dehydrogenase subunit E
VSANERQVGGEHYKNAPGVQHWDRMWSRYREAWFVGNITKYVERYREKGGIDDLEKARHYLEKLIELETQALRDTEAVLRKVRDNQPSVCTWTCGLCGHRYPNAEVRYRRSDKIVCLRCYGDMSVVITQDGHGFGHSDCAIGEGNQDA